MDFRYMKALVLVPHQDDELNVAANMIAFLRRQNTEVYVAYSTNGDWRYSLEKRSREAFAAGELLGIEKDHFIFLGYGDAANNDKGDHMFYAHGEPAVSAAGYSFTYGTGEVTDYAFSRHGIHRPYVYESLVEDIRDIMLDIRPDLILCVDWDYHSDHRMLAIAFDEAMGSILRSNPRSGSFPDTDYHPIVWKRFAYSLAYFAKSDYYEGMNVRETVRPDTQNTEHYDFDLIDTLYYDWDTRIRFPALPDAMRYPLRKNIVAQGLLSHKSQFIILHAEGIINSDEVYWERRTDSVSFKAGVSVSSGDGRYLNDFLVLGAVDIDSDPPALGNYLWMPDADDPVKQARFAWDMEQDISEVRLYGNFSGDGKILNVHMEFSNGFTLDTGELPEKGKCLKRTFACQKGIRWAVLTIDCAEGKNFGLSECEFYSDADARSVIPAYCKILIDNTFAYEYLIGPETTSCEIGAYVYGDAVTGRPQVEKGEAVIEDGRLFIPAEVKKVRLFLKGKTPDGKVLFDRMTVRRVSGKEVSAWKRRRTIDRLWLRGILAERKTRAALRVVTGSGVKGFIGKVKENVSVHR